MLILRCLENGEAHGFHISGWVRERTRGVLETPDAALYKALHRMEDRGWLDARWGRSEKRRKAKFYRLTPKGRVALEEERSAWSRFVAAIEHAMANDP